MRHAGSVTDSLQGRVGVVARLTVKEPDRGRAHFTRYVPLGSSPVAPYVAKNQKRDHSVAPVGNLAPEAGQ